MAVKEAEERGRATAKRKDTHMGYRANEKTGERQDGRREVGAEDRKKPAKRREPEEAGDGAENREGGKEATA